MNKKIPCTSITKENLASAYWILYKEKGIQKVKVKEIADLAGYNRSTFYEYFKDVFEIQEYIENSIFDYLEQEIFSDLDLLNDEDVINKLTMLYETKAEYLSVLLSEKGNPMFVKRFKNFFKEKMFQSLPIDNLHQNPYVHYLFEYVLSAEIGVITYWYQANDELSLREIIQLIRSLHMKATQKEFIKFIRLTNHVKKN